MTLIFGEHTDQVFDEPPLYSVLCQIRFPPILSLLNIAGLTGVQTVLRDEYPILLPIEQGIRIRSGPESVGVNTPPPVWKLQDSAADWTLNIAYDFVTLECFNYTSIEEFLAKFDRILAALRRTLRPANSTRIGLRKINLFAPLDSSQPFNYRNILRPEVLGLLGVEAFPVGINEGSSLLQFVEGENFLLINSGVGYNPERGRVGYSPERERRFFLDMDFSTSQPHEVMNGEPLTSLIRDFSDGMTNFFHWALLDEYKMRLGPHPRLRTER